MHASGPTGRKTMKRLPLTLAAVAAAMVRLPVVAVAAVIAFSEDPERCSLEAKLLSVASRHVDLQIRSVDAEGTRQWVYGELTIHCSVMSNGAELLPELRVSWEDVGVVNVWVRGLRNLRGRMLLHVEHAPAGCTTATGAFEVALAGLLDDDVPPYEGEDADEVLATTSDGVLVLFDRRDESGDTKIPLRFALPATRRDAYAQAVNAVERLRLWRETIGPCAPNERACQAGQIMALVDGALESARTEPAPRCRLSLDRPRNHEVLVLGHVSCELGVEVFENDTWRWWSFLAGPVHLDAYPSEADGGSALWSTAAGQGWNILDANHSGQVSIKLWPAFRREGGGGAMDGGLRSLFRIEAAASFGVPGFCDEPRWFHAAKTISYRPFAEPEVPAAVLDRAMLQQRPVSYACAVATILYGADTDTGYVHGALTLKRSLQENGVMVPFHALLGDGMTSVKRVLRAAGFLCRDVAQLQSVGHSSALPALGLGQWAKLQLWRLEYDRVIYLDSDVLVLRGISELFASLDDSAPLAAPNDYLSGGVLVLKPHPEEPFAATLDEDRGFYEYGEQDFLNVHFAGRHARLSLEYKCSAEKVASGESVALDQCSILEFDSCPKNGDVAWKPWHGVDMFNFTNFKVCFRAPDATIARLTARWAAVHARALADLSASGVALAPPRPYGPLADLTHFRVVGSGLSSV